MTVTTDEEQIRRSLALLCQLRDDGHYDQWVELFTEDGTFCYGGPTYRGRAEVKEHCETHFPPYGKHLCLNNTITIEGDIETALALRNTAESISLDFVRDLAPRWGWAQRPGQRLLGALRRSLLAREGLPCN